MKDSYHILVEAGESAGDKLTIPPEGARIGRSSKNDISLVDPLLSRHHCRVFFRDGGLWITDLGSANETLLDGIKVGESAIYRDNRITIGDTIMKVVNDGRPATSVPSDDSLVDLGLNSKPFYSKGDTKKPKQIGLGGLLMTLFIVVAIAITGLILKSMNCATPQKTSSIVVEPKMDMTLTVDYEKVEATNNNIFYYHLKITPAGVISIAIDDLQNNRSVRKEKKITLDLIEGLTEFLDQTGFFNLNESYEGVNPQILEQHTIAITIGSKTKQSTVINRVHPDIFSIVREKLEDFGRVELGLWAIEFSTEKLVEMSNNSYLLGKKLYAERLIARGNLAAAISSLKEAEWYLETVEKKPDFYADILNSRRTCISDLDQQYEDHNFQTERAIRLREWNTAASELRILLELIPDREDVRHKDARKKLVEVDARLESIK